MSDFTDQETFYYQQLGLRLVSPSLCHATAQAGHRCKWTLGVAARKAIKERLYDVHHYLCTQVGHTHYIAHRLAIVTSCHSHQDVLCNDERVLAIAQSIERCMPFSPPSVEKATPKRKTISNEDDDDGPAPQQKKKQKSRLNTVSPPTRICTNAALTINDQPEHQHEEPATASLSAITVNVDNVLTDTPRTTSTGCASPLGPHRQSLADEPHTLDAGSNTTTIDPRGISMPFTSCDDNNHNSNNLDALSLNDHTHHSTTLDDDNLNQSLVLQTGSQDNLASSNTPDTSQSDLDQASVDMEEDRREDSALNFADAFDQTLTTGGEEQRQDFDNSTCDDVTHSIAGSAGEEEEEERNDIAHIDHMLRSDFGLSSNIVTTGKLQLDSHVVEPVVAESLEVEWDEFLDERAYSDD